MPIPEEAKNLMAQAIFQSAGAYSLARNHENLQQLLDSIERELESADYVVLTRTELRNKVCDEYDDK